MKALFVLAGILFLSLSALAEGSQPRSLYANIFLLNPEMRYERDSSQQMLDRRPLNFAAGARKGSSTFILEYATYSEFTGNTTLSIDRDHKEYVFWWKENLMNLEFVDFFVSVGLGAYEEKVTTKLIGNSDAVDSSGMQVMGGTSAGLQSKIAGYVLLSVEGRLFAGKNFDPNPQASLLARLGVEF